MSGVQVTGWRRLHCNSHGPVAQLPLLLRPMPSALQKSPVRRAEDPCSQAYNAATKMLSSKRPYALSSKMNRPLWTSVGLSTAPKLPRPVQIFNIESQWLVYTRNPPSRSSPTDPRHDAHTASHSYCGAAPLLPSFCCSRSAMVVGCPAGTLSSKASSVRYASSAARSSSSSRSNSSSSSASITTAALEMRGWGAAGGVCAGWMWCSGHSLKRCLSAHVLAQAERDNTWRIISTSATRPVFHPQNGQLH